MEYSYINEDRGGKVRDQLDNLIILKDKWKKPLPTP
jgi:hypothetical protein